LDEDNSADVPLLVFSIFTI